MHRDRRRARAATDRPGDRLGTLGRVLVTCRQCRERGGGERPACQCCTRSAGAEQRCRFKFGERHGWVEGNPAPAALRTSKTGRGGVGGHAYWQHGRCKKRSSRITSAPLPPHLRQKVKISTKIQPLLAGSGPAARPCMITIRAARAPVPRLLKRLPRPAFQRPTIGSPICICARASQYRRRGQASES